jgi:hypothetical protein
MNYDDQTVEELRDELRDRDLKVSGTKEDLVARLREDDEVSRDAVPKSVAPTTGLRAVLDRIREEFRDITGFQIERATGLSRREDGWEAKVDVVEVARIPPSTDVLATYLVTADGDGALQSLDRIHRYRRSEADAV